MTNAKYCYIQYVNTLQLHFIFHEIVEVNI